MRRFPILTENDSASDIVVVGNSSNVSGFGVISSLVGVSLYQDTSAITDAVMVVRQPNPRGFGLSIVPGNNENYALSIKNAAETASVHEFFGNGNVTLAAGERGTVGIGTSEPDESVKLHVQGRAKATEWVVGDVVFEKMGRPLWRMIEEEDGLYLISLVNGKRFKVCMEPQ